MGGEIVYCEVCKTRLGVADFQKKNAIRVGAKSYCRACAPMDAFIDDDFANEPTPVPGKTGTRAIKKGTQTIKKVAQPGGYEGTRRVPRAEMDRRAGGGNKGLIIGISIAAVALLVVVIAVMSGGGKPPPEAPPPTASSAPAVPAPSPAAVPASAPPAAPVIAPSPGTPGSKEDLAKEAVKKARDYVSSKPQDLSGQLELWRQAVVAAEGLPMVGELRRTVEMVQQQLRDQIRNDLQPVDEDSLAARHKEEFGRAIKVLEDAHGRHSAEEWKSAIEKRIRETKAQAAQVFATVKQEALDFKRRGLAERVKGITDRLARWGMPGYAEDLQRELGGQAAAAPAVPATPAATPPAPGPVPATPPPVAPATSGKPSEADLYQKQWQAAMALAGARDYAAAISTLDKVLEAIQDKALLKEAAGDVELLRQVRSLHAEALAALAKLPKGQKVAVEYADAEGKKARVEGAVVRAAASWLEIKKDKASVFIDFAEMAPASLLEPSKAKADPATMGLLALLEREEALAKSLSGAAAEKVAEKYWKHGASPAPAASPKEAEARALFYAAWPLERDWPEGTRKGGLTPRYRKLLADHAETSVVRRHRDLLQRLVGPAKETVFLADDLVGSGTFSQKSQEKIGSFWAVTAEPLQSKALENFVQFEFTVGPEPAPPKCWVYAGGCCAESLDLYWQATDLADEKTGRKIEPGESAAAPLKAAIAGLPKAHGGHPPKADPAKWGWIPVPLPKSAGEGVKKVRLLSERPGFAVAYAVVSTARGSPPKDSDVKALDRTEVVAVTTLAEGLVAHWTFDEGKGNTAADASGKGRNGTLEKGAAWAAGRLGGALQLDGSDDFVKIPHDASLEPGHLTVSAWVNVPSVKPGGKDRGWIVGKSDNEHKDGHYALVVGRDNQAVAYLNIGGGSGNCHEVWSAANAVPLNAWVHLALTFDAKDLAFYVNGQPVGTKSIAKGRVPSTADLIIGKRPDDFSKTKGLVDDVRIYNRALTPLEILALGRGQAK